MITANDINWAIETCERAFQTPTSHTGSSFFAREWYEHCAWMNGYYHTMLKYLGGYGAKSIRSQIEGQGRYGYSTEAKRAGGRRARYVWKVLLSQRGERLEYSPWTFSELQFRILADSTTNRLVFDNVRQRLERHIRSESTVHAQREGTNPTVDFRNTRGGTIRRLGFQERNRNYSRVLSSHPVPPLGLRMAG